jgi:hypothetical protein
MVFILATRPTVKATFPGIRSCGKGLALVICILDGMADISTSLLVSMIWEEIAAT